MPVDEEYIPAKRHRHGPVATYEVFVEDFDRVEEEATNVGTDLQFGIFWLSVAITSTFAFITAISEWRVYFFIAMLVGYGFGAYFYIKWRNQGNALCRLMNRIRASQVGPMGQEGKELGPGEVSNLPATEAGQGPRQS